MADAKPETTSKPEVAPTVASQSQAQSSATSDRSGLKRRVWTVVGVIGILICLWIGLREFKEYRAEERKKAEVAAEQERAAKQQKQAEAEKPRTVTISDTEWTTVEVPPRVCFRAWDSKDPAADTFHAQAVRVNTTRAIDWATYRSQIAMGKIPHNDLGWVKLMSKGGEVVMKYSFHPAPCRKQ